MSRIKKIKNDGTRPGWETHVPDSIQHQDLLLEQYYDDGHRLFDTQNVDIEIASLVGESSK